MVAARAADYLDEVVGELEELGARGLAVPTDTGDVAQCRALVERAVEHFGRLDVVVSSAAKGTPNHTIMNAELDDWQQAWLVNVLGPLELFRAAVPHLAAQESGAIVVVSTLAVRAINAGQGAYAATKAALTVAAQTLAREVGVDGIRVNIVVPGFVPGPNTEDDVRPDGGAAEDHGRRGAGADRRRAPRCGACRRPTTSPTPSCSSRPSGPVRSPARRST